MLNNNKREDDKQNAPPLASQNNPCGVCRAFGVPPPCRGHGGKSGGDGTGSGSSEGENNNNNKPESGSNRTDHPALNTESSPNTTHSPQNEVNTLSLDWTQQLTSSITVIQLDKGLLHLKCDNLRGVLTIQEKLELSKENIQSAKQAKQMMKAEFDLFKEELQEKGVMVNHFITTIKDDCLTIKIPHPKYFAEFIQRLAEKNLLPTLNVDKQTVTLESTTKTKKPPSPFDISKGPTPKY